MRFFGYIALALALLPRAALAQAAGAPGAELARIRGELAATSGGDPASIVAVLTGGLSAAPWARGIAGVDAIDPDLTLKGLVILHAEVTGGTRPDLARAATGWSG